MDEFGSKGGSGNFIKGPDGNFVEVSDEEYSSFRTKKKAFEEKHGRLFGDEYNHWGS